jgi:hypothetical protein
MSLGTPGGREVPPSVEMEAHLIAHTHRERARQEARELCARMPWLTSAQAEDLARHYVPLRIGLSRRMLREVTERADQLRREYEARYQELRRDLLRRHAAAACATLACAAGLGSLALLATR